MTQSRAASAILLVGVMVWTILVTEAAPPPGPDRGSRFAYDLVALVAMGAWAGLIVAMPLFHADMRDRNRRDRVKWMAAALVLYPGYSAGFSTSPANYGGNLWPGLFAAALFGAVAMLWIREALLRRDGRGPVYVALVSLAAPLWGAAELAARGDYDATRSGGTSGVIRVLSVAVMALAMMRHQLLGIELKLRWGISRTTVAAFFVASEAAQQFFGDRFNNTYVGILSAGALLFAFSPLSRIADRMASGAVPAGPARQSDDDANERAFEAAVRAAIRDGVLTRREEAYLAEVSDHLGIGARRALEIRGHVEKGTQGST